MNPQPPAWLAHFSDRAIRDPYRRLEEEAARLGLPRPTLLDLEGERARRGLVLRRSRRNG